MMMNSCEKNMFAFGLVFITLKKKKKKNQAEQQIAS